MPAGGDLSSKLSTALHLRSDRNGEYTGRVQVHENTCRYKAQSAASPASPSATHSLNTMAFVERVRADLRHPTPTTPGLGRRRPGRDSQGCSFASAQESILI